MGMCAARILTLSAIDVIETPNLIKEAWNEFHERKQKNDEAPLLPKGLKPPVELRWPEWVTRPGSEWWIPSTTGEVARS